MFSRNVISPYHSTGCDLLWLKGNTILHVTILPNRCWFKLIIAPLLRQRDLWIIVNSRDPNSPSPLSSLSVTSPTGSALSQQLTPIYTYILLVLSCHQAPNILEILSLPNPSKSQNTACQDAMPFHHPWLSSASWCPSPLHKRTSSSKTGFSDSWFQTTVKLKIGFGSFCLCVFFIICSLSTCSHCTKLNFALH